MPSRLELIEKLPVTLLDAKESTSGLLNRGGIAKLPLRTLLAICKKSQEPNF